MVGQPGASSASSPRSSVLPLLFFGKRLNEAVITQLLEMTLGGSAIARGVVASPLVFASTSSRSAS